VSEALLNKPRAEGDFFKAVLDHITVPIMVVDSSGDLIYANGAASQLISERALLAAEDGKLIFVPDHVDGPIKAAISEACISKVGHAVSVADNNLYPSVAVVVPFDGSDGETANHAIVLLSNGSDINVALMDLLRHQFNLSVTEAKITVALGTGADLKDVARERGVTLNTLRTQLASIMEKTGFHRQAALVAFIARIKTLL
jgi:DNA-binding CsgD family transcriptional regulator